MIDATSEDVIGEYNTIVQELQSYGRELRDKTQIIALNKIDAVDKESVDLEELATELNHLSYSPVSSFRR